MCNMYTNETKPHERGIGAKERWILAAAVVAAIGGGAGLALSLCLGDSWPTRGQIGDSFAPLTSMLTLSAVLITVVSVLIQRRELELQREELASQREEQRGSRLALEGQVQAMQQQALALEKQAKALESQAKAVEKQTQALNKLDLTLVRTLTRPTKIPGFASHDGQNSG
jgi:hypothetical protein